mgnify:FL=1
MTPQEQELVKKLAEQVNNIAHLVAGTEAGESQTLKEIRDLVYRHNKGMEENSTIETAKRFLYDGNHNFIERELINFCKRTIKEFEENELKVLLNTNTTQPPY